MEGIVGSRPPFSEVAAHTVVERALARLHRDDVAGPQVGDVREGCAGRRGAAEEHRVAGLAGEHGVGEVPGPGERVARRRPLDDDDAVQAGRWRADQGHGSAGGNFAADPRRVRARRIEQAPERGVEHVLAPLLLQAAQPEGEDPEEQARRRSTTITKRERQGGDAGPGRTRALCRARVLACAVVRFGTVSAAPAPGSLAASPSPAGSRRAPRRPSPSAAPSAEPERQRHARAHRPRRGRRAARRGSPRSRAVRPGAGRSRPSRPRWDARPPCVRLRCLGREQRVAGQVRRQDGVDLEGEVAATCSSSRSRRIGAVVASERGRRPGAGVPRTEGT